MWAIAALSLFFFSACSPECKNMVDGLNERSYAFHYRNIDSTETYALKALKHAVDYDDGKAEAYNNLAFVSIARMDYGRAYALIDSVSAVTDNQIELLVADIQGMRLCQRMSRNKEFYDYNERARQRIKRVNEEIGRLSPRLARRFIYAKSEYDIVRSTYYYYVGLTKQSIDAIDSISAPELQQDTAQYLNYLYQVGSGGIITERTAYDTYQKEFEYLLNCYLTASRGGYVYWEANALQSLSEHLSDKERRFWLTTNNPVTINYINKDNMSDSLLAGNLARRSLDMFISYGDIYQIAGSYRTLASCYWNIGDYTSSLVCLKGALSDKRIAQAPDLVASIRELLSLTYSALDDKANSDINRNLYLDMQEKTRQDRQLEARAGQLERTSIQLNVLAGFILFLLLVVVVLIIILKYIRQGKNRNVNLDALLQPLRKWETLNERHFKQLADKREQIDEAVSVCRLHIEKGKKRNIENRAKIFLASSIMPYIDRIINEVRRLEDSNEPEDRRRERFEYITELTERIGECNDVLTHWIQLQQGQLSIRIESFRLQDVFDILAKASMSFKMKGIDFKVKPTDAVVKADKTLTLFMLNTLADNSRKFTDRGGHVSVYAIENETYVEVSVTDDGCGMGEEELAGLFDRSLNDGHGFGLLNCRGIIEKYRKISRIFSVCGLFADSQKGCGSRFYFHLPNGVVRAVLALLLSVSSISGSNAYADGLHHRHDDAVMHEYLKRADAYADSAYYSNLNGTYTLTLAYADSSRTWLNKYYKTINPDGRRLMTAFDDGNEDPAEVSWLKNGVNTNYNIILDIRNESAVAALALHEWNVYHYNNTVYTQLFKLKSADDGLAEYCRTMQRSSSNTAIAVIVLVFLLVTAIVIYYLLYYRHVLYFRFCVDNVNNLNKILLSPSDSKSKLNEIQHADTSKYPEPLRRIVDTIKDALRRSVDESGRSLLDIELATDELRRAEYEDAKLYVSNNVTDNCLSALKHETMYYPSRVRQLIDSPDCDIHAVSEVALYYRELCSLLNRQAVSIAAGVMFDCNQVDIRLSGGDTVRVLGDEVLFNHMFDIIKKQNAGVKPELTAESDNGRYIVLIAVCRNISINEKQCGELFTPSVGNIPYLICRQIVRYCGEATNLHACGIVADSSAGGLVMRFTLAKA